MMVIILTIMARQRPYTLVYAPAVKGHLKAIDAKYHALIREKIEEQLQLRPGAETRNRKPLRQPAAFEVDRVEPGQAENTVREQRARLDRQQHHQQHRADAEIEQHREREFWQPFDCDYAGYFLGRLTRDYVDAGANK